MFYWPAKKSDKEYRTGELIWIQHLSQSCGLKYSLADILLNVPPPGNWKYQNEYSSYLVFQGVRNSDVGGIPHRPGDRPLYYPRPTQHYTMCVGHTLQCWPRHARWRLEHQKWSLSPCDHWDVKVSIKNLLRQGNDTFNEVYPKYSCWMTSLNFGVSPV